MAYSQIQIGPNCNRAGRWNLSGAAHTLAIYLLGFEWEFAPSDDAPIQAVKCRCRTHRQEKLNLPAGLPGNFHLPFSISRTRFTRASKE